MDQELSAGVLGAGAHDVVWADAGVHVAFAVPDVEAPVTLGSSVRPVSRATNEPSHMSGPKRISVSGPWVRQMCSTTLTAFEEVQVVGLRLHLGRGVHVHDHHGAGVLLSRHAAGRRRSSPRGSSPHSGRGSGPSCPVRGSRRSRPEVNAAEDDHVRIGRGGAPRDRANRPCGRRRPGPPAPGRARMTALRSFASAHLLGHAPDLRRQLRMCLGLDRRQFDRHRDSFPMFAGPCQSAGSNRANELRHSLLR